MFNLIFKDILIQKKVILFYIATIIIYLLVDVSPIPIVVLNSLTFINMALSYDEKDNANILLNSLPYTRKEIVSSRYVGVLIFTSLFIIITYGGSFLLNGKETSFSWKAILQIMGLVMVAISFMLPVFYKFKRQYLVFAAGALIGIYLVTSKFLVPDLNKILRELTRKFLTLQETQMYLIAIPTIVILYIGSWLLSIRIYERKAF
ncbi:ABC-2 transporter permease [Lysinibacillus sp. NPDC059133]|uniref:ABC-2 transporter permease n=1 Tax=Lysinibacillus sp. NPDC059133 TaxID=3346737 RepID=UPI0036CD2D6F